MAGSIDGAPSACTDAGLGVVAGGEGLGPEQLGDVAGAVRALVGDYERMGDANFRWAASERLEILADLLDEARRSHQEWIVAMFGDRLPTTPAARRRAVHALHVATDVYSWKLLRRDLHLSRTETEKTLAALVAGVLEGTTR